MRITLITAFPQSKNKRRASEYDTCLRRNLDNRYFDEVVVLKEEDGTRNIGSWSSRAKLKVVDVGHRATYVDYLKIANALSGGVVIANSDVYFDWSASKLHYIKENALHVITRTDRLDNLHSSDAWAFVPPLQVQGCDWVLGRIGCETAFICEVKKQLGWRLWNLCYEVRLAHLHGSRVFSKEHGKWVRFTGAPRPLVATLDKDKGEFCPQKQKNVVRDQAVLPQSDSKDVSSPINGAP